MRTSHLLLSLFSLSTMVACFGKLDVGSGTQAAADRDAGTPPSTSPSPPSARDGGASEPATFYVETVVADTADSVVDLEVDDTNVYWSSRPVPGSLGSNGVKRARKAPNAGAPATLVAGLPSVFHIELSGSEVFVADTLSYDLVDRYDGAILRAPKSGGAATTLVTGLPRFNGTRAPVSLVFSDSRSIYYGGFTAPAAGTYRVDLLSGAVSQLSVLPAQSMCSFPSGQLAFGHDGIVSVDGSAYSWQYGHNFTCADTDLVGVRSAVTAGRAHGEIVLLSGIDASVVRVLATTNISSNVGIAVDGPYVYYTESVGASSPAGAKPAGIYRVSMTGGTPEVVSLAGAAPGDEISFLSLKVSEHTLYWAERRGGVSSIRRALLVHPG